MATLKTLLTCCLRIVHSALRIAAFQLCIFVLRGNKADLLSRLNIEFFKKRKEIGVEIWLRKIVTIRKLWIKIDRAVSQKTTPSFEW